MRSLTRSMLSMGLLAILAWPAAAGQTGRGGALQQEPIETEAGVLRDEVLHKAAVFAVGPVGFGAQTSRGELALRGILAQLDPVPALLDLLERGSPAGQLYALVGLSMAHPERFKIEVARFGAGELADREVATMTGCIVSPERFGDVVDRISRGRYAVRLSPHAPPLVQVVE